jgi:hypothetical protein
VADAWQGRGLGTALLELLADRAREEGLRRFKAVVLADNRPMLEVLEGLGETKLLDSSAGTVELVIDLPENGLGAELHDALRAAASGPVRLALPLSPFEPKHPLVVAPPSEKSRPPAA